MKYAAFMVVGGVVLSLAALPVVAQQGPMGGPGPGPGMGTGMQQEVTPEKFPEFKAQVLKNIDERLKRMTEHRACAEKAATHEEMKKCRPEPPMGGRPDAPRRQWSKTPASAANRRRGTEAIAGHLNTNGRQIALPAVLITGGQSSPELSGYATGSAR